jgi:hypothetical protein
VYTEDNVETAFNAEVVVGEGRNSIGPFSPGLMTIFAYGSPQSQKQNCYSQITEAGATQSYRLAAWPSPKTFLPNSCVDPFFNPPVRLSAPELEAVDHSKCHVKSSSNGQSLILNKFIEALSIHSLLCEVVGCSIESEGRSLFSSFCPSLRGTSLLCEIMDKINTLCIMQQQLGESCRNRFAIQLHV